MTPEIIAQVRLGRSSVRQLRSRLESRTLDEVDCDRLIAQAERAFNAVLEVPQPPPTRRLAFSVIEGGAS